MRTGLYVRPFILSVTWMTSLSFTMVSGRAEHLLTKSVVIETGLYFIWMLKHLCSLPCTVERCFMDILYITVSLRSNQQIQSKIKIIEPRHPWAECFLSETPLLHLYKCTDLKWTILYTNISTCVSNTCTHYLVAYNFKCILRVLKMYCRSINVCQKSIASCREKKIIKKWDAWLFDLSDGYVQLCLCWGFLLVQATLIKYLCLWWSCPKVPQTDWLNLWVLAAVITCL